MIAGLPLNTVPMPGAVERYAVGAVIVPVWQNELGGLTYELTWRDRREFLKWNPSGSGIQLAPEVERLSWASTFVTVPVIVEEGSDAEGQWIVSRAIVGDSAVADKWRSDPHSAVVGLGRALRLLHDSLPVEGCPFSWSVADRVASAVRLSPDCEPDASALLANQPLIDQLVVCHGDACAPNTILDDAGRPAGFVDLGSLGVADRWADLAIASWSLEWNFGPSLDGEFFAAYEIAPDAERIAYYRTVWDL